MHVENITLTNFRNFRHATFRFREHINFIVGPNARGKTNLLEAVSVLLCGVPLRSIASHALVSWGSDELALEGIVRHRTGSSSLRVAAGAATRSFVQGARLAPVRARAPVVFTPEDLRTVRDEPERRRAFIDAVSARLTPGYAKRRQEYERVLRQRNALLKETTGAASLATMLPAWDAQLVALGAWLAVHRRTVVSAIEEPAAQAYSFIGAEADRERRLALAYESTVLAAGATEAEAAEGFRAKLEARREDEILRRMTLVGPHRDDVSIAADGVDLRLFGSRGEQRMAAIALKVAERSLVADMLGEQPVLLLDDVLSELDRDKRLRLLEAVGDGQVLITTTAIDGFEPTALQRAEVIALD